MNNPDQNSRPLRAALLLALIACVAGSVVALVKLHTSERIVANEKQAREQRITQLLPPHSYDNRPGEDRLLADDALLGKTPQSVFRARRGGEPIAGVIQVTTEKGYNGRIVLLVGVDLQGTVLGVRTLRHRETPGLGDGIELHRSDWISQFEDSSLAEANGAWSVRRDGGRFDHLTGATVTSRAVIGAVHNALIYFDRNQSRIFTPPGEP